MICRGRWDEGFCDAVNIIVIGLALFSSSSHVTAGSHAEERLTAFIPSFPFSTPTYLDPKHQEKSEINHQSSRHPHKLTVFLFRELRDCWTSDMLIEGWICKRFPSSVCEVSLVRTAVDLSRRVCDLHNAASPSVSRYSYRLALNLRFCDFLR